MILPAAPAIYLCQSGQGIYFKERLTDPKTTSSIASMVASLDLMLTVGTSRRSCPAGTAAGFASAWVRVMLADDVLNQR